MLGKLRYELIRLPDRRSTFEADVLEHDEQHIVLAHRVYPSRPFLYRGEEALGTDYLIVWFLFKDQPFDVGRFYRPDGTWTGYYADVLEPVPTDTAGRSEAAEVGPAQPASGA